MSNFQDLALIPNVKIRLKELEFDELFPIQEKAISPILKGRDVIGQAKTGTGKTAAYAIPIIEKLRKKRSPSLNNYSDKGTRSTSSKPI